MFYKFYIIDFLLFTIEFTLCFLFHNSLFPLGLGMYPIILFYLISRILYLIIANSLLLKLMNIKLKTNILIIKKLVSLVSFFVLYSLYFSFFFFYNGIKISNSGNILQILIYENNYSCLSFLFLYSSKLYILAFATGLSSCFFSKYLEILSLLITLESLE